MRLPRFYPILDSEVAARHGLSVVKAAAAILEGGARILQLRHKQFFSRELIGEAEQIAELCRQAAALFVINDRADIARLLGAAVHIGQTDLPPVDTRRVLGAIPVIGYSTHNEIQLRAAGAEPVDYVALGPIYGTGSKANPDPVVGVEQMARLRPFTRCPMVAIGGITLENAQGVFEAGADTIAVISDLWPDPRNRTAAWMRIAS
jgi:thiamine-phosphate pyrophosphorylase